jgi:predicted CoA-binding protein
MATLEQIVDDFLAQRRIAVAGVSSTEPNAPANLILRKLRDAGHEVFAVNPKVDTVEGGPCHPSLAAIPGGVDAVVAATPPAGTDAVVRECIELGVSRVWMHRSFGEGSVSSDAVQLAREHGIQVIDGACPMMYCAPVDFAHRCMRWVLGVTGGIPKGR